MYFNTIKKNQYTQEERGEKRTPGKPEERPAGITGRERSPYNA